MNEKEQIIECWNILNNLIGSIKCDCTIEQDETVNINCLYYKCKDFIKAVDGNNKY